MLKQVATLWIVFIAILKYFWMPRGMSSKNILDKEIKMDHHKVVSDVLEKLKEDKESCTPEEYKKRVEHALKIVEVQYSKIKENLQKVISE